MIDLDRILDDSRQFNSAATTLFYIYLCNLPPGEDGWTLVKARCIAAKLGVTNPYLHMRRIADAGLMERKNLGTHGTMIRITVEGEQ